MIRRKVKSLIFVFVLLEILLCSCLFACDFVQYIEYDNNDCVTIENTKNDEIKKLYDCFVHDDYNDEEWEELYPLLVDCEREINEGTNIDEICNVREKHLEILLSVKTKIKVKSEKSIEELTTAIDVDDYNEAEKKEINKNIELYSEKIANSETFEEIDIYVNEYNGLIAKLKEVFDKYNERSNLLFNELKNLFIYSNYYVSTAEIIKDKVNSFDQFRQNTFNEQLLNDEYQSSVLFIQSKKNITQELNEKLSNKKEQFVKRIDDYITQYSGDIKKELRDKHSMVKENIQSSVSIVDVETMAFSYLKELYNDIGDITLYQSLAEEEISICTQEKYYEENEQKIVEELLNEYLKKIGNAISIENVETVLTDFKQAISQIDDVENKWAKRLDDFRNSLQQDFGNNILKEPSSLTEASDLIELSEIIDYFAFYQKNNVEFYCNTFKVKLNFEHSSAEEMKIQLYFYCELLRTAVGYDFSFIDNGDLVVKLIPYSLGRDVSSVTVDRNSSPVTFNNGKTNTLKARGDDFDDFAYLQNENTITGIWNTQQLWYALEHKYIPVCVSGSVAEKTLLRAKELLRSIIYDGMTDAEKIFALYKYFGENCTYAPDFYTCISQSSDVNAYPDESIALTTTGMAEGVLLYNKGVCFSFAKASCILLNMEGIDCYYTSAKHNTLMSYSSEVGHGYDYIYIDGNWFICDMLRGFYTFPDFQGVSYLFFMMPANDLAVNFTNRSTHVNEKIYNKALSEGIYDISYYSKLEINGESIYFDSLDNAEQRISNIFAKDDKVINILCERSIKEDICAIIENYSEYEITEKAYNDTFIVEFCLLRNTD